MDQLTLDFHQMLATTQMIQAQKQINSNSSIYLQAE